LGKELTFYSYTSPKINLTDIQNELLQSLKTFFTNKLDHQKFAIETVTESGMFGKSRILALQKRRIEIIDGLIESTPKIHFEGNVRLLIDDHISGIKGLIEELTIKVNVRENKPDVMDLRLPSVEQVFKVFSAISVHQVENDVRMYVIELEKDLEGFKKLAKSFITLDASIAKVNGLLENTKKTFGKTIKTIEMIYSVCSDRLGSQSAQAETLDGVLTKLKFFSSKNLAHLTEKKGVKNVNQLYSKILEVIEVAGKVLQIFDPIVVAPLFLNPDYLSLLTYAIALIQNSIQYWTFNSSRLDTFKALIWPFFVNYGFIFRIYHPESYIYSPETVQMLRYTRLHFHSVAEDANIRVEMKNVNFHVSLPVLPDFMGQTANMRILSIFIPYSGNSMNNPDKTISQTNHNTISLIKSLQKSINPSYMSSWWEEIDVNDWLPMTTITAEVRSIERHILGTNQAMCGCCWLYHNQTPEFSFNEIDVMEIEGHIGVSM
jgi:hypothetical protein